MKIFTIIIAIILASFIIQAQDYQISFTASGASTTVDSVQVKNLDQQTELTLNGSDILHLTDIVSIPDINNILNGVSVYPNPMTESSNLRFYQRKPGKTKIEIYNISGKLLSAEQIYLENGTHEFTVSGLPAGLFTIKITNKEFTDAVKLSNLNGKKENASIVYSGIIEDEKETQPKLKSTRSLVDMQYNDGELIRLIGYSSQYVDISTFVPTQTETVEFVFIVNCPGTVTDYDGNIYDVVQIGNQCWISENLKVTHYPNGTAIPLVTNNTDWANLDDNNTDDAYCYYNNNSGSEADIYGALYTWAAAMGDNAISSSSNPSGVQGVCPTGWHLPSDDEWKELEMALGMSQAEADAIGYHGTNEGSKLAGNSSLWASGTLTSNAEFGTSGFTGLPGGYRNYDDGSFYILCYYGYFRSATEGNSSNAWIRKLANHNTEVSRYDNSKSGGFSVRCLQD